MGVVQGRVFNQVFQEATQRFDHSELDFHMTGDPFAALQAQIDEIFVEGQDIERAAEIHYVDRLLDNHAWFPMLSVRVLMVGPFSLQGHVCHH